MTISRTRRAFRLFHAVLALGLAAISVMTLLHALAEGDLHLAILAGVEALGAILLLVPATLRWGGGLLLVTFLVAFVTHLLHHEVELQLLIYAAGVWFVMVHGAAWGHGSTHSDAAA